VRCVQRRAGRLREAHGHPDEVERPTLAAVGVGEERELGHDPDEAPVLRLGHTAGTHLGGLAGNQLVADAVGRKDLGDGCWDAGEQRRGGATGISTGSKVLSLTSSATCGRHRRTVAYQLPRTVVVGSAGAGRWVGRRSRSFCVPWRVNTLAVSPGVAWRVMFGADLRHYLDLDADVPGPARAVATRLSRIVRAGTAGDAGSARTSGLPCDRRPGRRPCPGRLVLRRAGAEPSIAWRCSACGDEGVVSGWEGSPFDLRRTRPVAVPRDRERVVVDAEVAVTLYDLLTVDADTERMIFRAETADAGIALDGGREDFDMLLDAVAAEANHADDRRRRQRLDAAYDVMSRAVERHFKAGHGAR
jgi:hypothetical protein